MAGSGRSPREHRPPVRLLVPRRRPWNWPELAVLPIAWLAVLAGARGAGTEELLVMGMGRSLGWLVASETGEVQFRDCQGQLTASPGRRVEPTARRCPSP